MQVTETEETFVERVRTMFSQGVLEVRILRVNDPSLPNRLGIPAALAASRVLARHVAGNLEIGCYRCEAMVKNRPGGFVVVSQVNPAPNTLTAMVASLCPACAQPAFGGDIVAKVQDGLHAVAVPIENYHPEGGSA